MQEIKGRGQGVLHGCVSGHIHSECTATTQLDAWKMCVCVCVCVEGIHLLCTGTPIAVRERARVSIGRTIHHEARLPVIVMVASWRSLGSETHTLLDKTNHQAVLVIHEHQLRGVGNIQG